VECDLARKFTVYEPLETWDAEFHIQFAAASKSNWLLLPSKEVIKLLNYCIELL
jgi:hypothetical protein